MSPCHRDVRDLLTLAPFDDNGSFLSAKLREWLLRLEYSSWHLALVTEDRPNLPSVPPPSPSLSPATRELRRQVDLRERRYLLSRAWNAKRLAVSGRMDIPFRDVAAEHELDTVEQDALWVLFFWTTSPVFRQRCPEPTDRMRDLATHPLLPVCCLLELLSPDPALQVGLLRYFRPDARLRAHELARVEFVPRDEGSLLEARLYLPDNIAFRIAGT